MADSLKAFEQELERFGRVTVPAAVQAVATRGALLLFRRITLRVPVDTGNARANMSINPGSPDRSMQETGDIGEGAATSRAMAKTSRVTGALPLTPIWITNNVAYFEALEFGHSKQRPEGMVRISLAEFNAADINRIIKQVSREFSVR